MIITPKVSRAMSTGRELMKIINEVLIKHQSIICKFNATYGGGLHVGMITITKVIVLGNTRAATVYYTINSFNKIDKNFFVFFKNRILPKIKARVNWRRCPQLTFQYDKAFERLISSKIYQKESLFEHCKWLKETDDAEDF